MENKTCGNCGRIYRTERDFLLNTIRWRLSAEKSLWFNCSCGSTMVMPEGMYPWFSMDRVLHGKARTFFERLAVREFPYVRDFSMSVLPDIEDDRKSADQLAQRIRQHPMVMAEIFRVGRRRAGLQAFQFTSLAQAISFLGRRAVKEVVFLAELGSIEIRTSSFDRVVFWNEMLDAGWIAEALAHRFAPSLCGDDVFMAGALVNVGKLVHAILLPREADEVWSFALNRAWRAAERLAGAAEHTVLGELACSLWGFDDQVRECTISHHNSAFARNTSNPSLAEIVSFACVLNHVLHNRPHRIEEQLLRQHHCTFALTGGAFGELLDWLAGIKDAMPLMHDIP